MADVTTLKLPKGLKRRIAPLAKALGRTPHAWMVDTLKEETERAERHEKFIQDSLEAAARIDAGGALYDGDAVHAYVLGRTAGKKASRPRPVRRAPRRR